MVKGRLSQSKVDLIGVRLICIFIDTVVMFIDMVFRWLKKLTYENVTWTLTKSSLAHLLFSDCKLA